VDPLAYQGLSPVPSEGGSGSVLDVSARGGGWATGAGAVNQTVGGLVRGHPVDAG